MEEEEEGVGARLLLQLLNYSCIDRQGTEGRGEGRVGGQMTAATRDLTAGLRGKGGGRCSPILQLW